MWFKQIQLFQLSEKMAYTPEIILDKLEAMAFTPCLPSFPMSVGWVSPLGDEHTPLVHAANGFIMLCMQVEEKILPATVIRHELNEKVKKIEKREERKVRQKDKLSLKDEVIMDLLPRAFSKMTKLYAYIDTKNSRLVVGTTNQTRIDQFITLFKRSFDQGFQLYDVKKISPILTNWIKIKNHPKEFNIEEAAVLQDPNQQKRIVRCQHQDLFANSIQSFIKEGCEVKQIALCWQDRINFILADDFSLRSIQFHDQVLAAAKEIDVESKQQQFDADFFIMTQTFSGLFDDLLREFMRDTENEKKAATANA
jgi:recombination associated protein RdgC